MTFLFPLCVSPAIHYAPSFSKSIAPGQNVQAVLGLLDKVEETAKSIPPVDNKASRFGNPAFRTFYDKVAEVRRSCLVCFNSDVHYTF